MILVYGILILFVIVGFLAIFEDSLTICAKKSLFAIFGILLIVMAAFREVGIDPDSETYLHYMQNFRLARKTTEPSFIFIVQFLQNFTKEPAALFFIYALLGVSLKLIAIPKYGTETMLMGLLIYLCNYYEMHETTQIRAGVLSGFYLLAVPYIVDDNRKIALLLILIGSVFHISGLALLPLLFLSNKPLTNERILFWALLIPVAYMITSAVSYTFAGGEGYIAERLHQYQKTADTSEQGHVHIFSPLHLFNVLLFYYFLYFAPTITEHNKYFPILLKIFGLSLFLYISFAFLPVLGERISYLYSIPSIVLIPCIMYTIKPRVLGRIVAWSVGFIYLNYILRSMYNFTFILHEL